MAKYDHGKIEKKWQKIWDERQAFHAETDPAQKKEYLLIEFPYPSGDGLHVGHIRSWTALDAVARKRRMQGKNVLYPIGWDAFGLPTENYALKTGKDPRTVTKENTDNFRRQIKSLGISFDWQREINTTDPSYYKWTQWIFLQLFKKGLAYKAKTLINWCPKDKIGLANEEVIDGKCERCGTAVEKREKEQWMLAITKYAQRLYDDLDTVDYIPPAKLGQKNWIGPSEGAEIEFPIARSDQKITIFTTRPDTIFSATYMVLAPEHPLVEQLKSQIENWDEVVRYVTRSKNTSEIERSAEGKEKTGVELKGILAINPANKAEIPVWIADYVLASYGTGAIMAVPAHDERDRSFAEKFNLPIVDEPLVDGKEITERVGGVLLTTFKLRDWVFSRQRYWGEPIPMIKCAKDGWVPVPEDQLPVVLPQVEKYQPTDTGESPLANIRDFVDTTCPTCGGPAERETDVMPNWAGSSWYYLRYTDPANTEIFAGKDAMNYWTPVDWYNGGMEHTTLHLLYSRFWHKFLFDLGLVPSSEPYLKRTSHGLILAEDGSKMSKSKGNVVNPDSIVEQFGADALRLYEMFLGPFDQPVSWSTNSIAGSYRFLERMWAMHEKIADMPLNDETELLLNQTIKKVGDDIENLKMNTAVSSLMIFANHLGELREIPRAAYVPFVKLLAPLVPHIAHEIAEQLQLGSGWEDWPTFDESKTRSRVVSIAVQVNGKVRGSISIAAEAPEAEALAAARGNADVAKWLTKGVEKKAVYVPGKIISFVVQDI